MLNSRGTEMYELTTGSLSVIMNSFGVVGETERSTPLASLENSSRHSGPWMRCRSETMRSGRMVDAPVAEVEVDDEDELE